MAFFCLMMRGGLMVPLRQKSFGRHPDSCNGNIRLFASIAMIYTALKLTHVLSILVWVGGMVFAHFFLRPALAALQPPERLRLMHDVLGRFFKVVLLLSTWAVVSGLWMIAMARAGGTPDAPFRMPLAWTVMATLGIVMWLIFGHIRFALYKRLSRAVAAVEWPAAGTALAKLRLWVTINMVIGLLTVVVAFVL